jgi:hypothetical protein
MGFGIPNIGDAVKRAVHTVSDAVGGVAKKVGGEGAKAAEPKVAPAIHGAFEGSKGRDGFDGQIRNLPYRPDQDHGHIILIDSKPKGGSNVQFV